MSFIAEDQDTLTNYKTFFGIVTRSLKKIQELINERNHYSDKEELSDHDIDCICEKNAEIQRYAMVTILFSVMTLESYINHYGIYYSTRNFFDNFLDKLDLKGKWILFPKMVYNKIISMDSQAYEQLTKLISLRNRLVHDKARIKPISETTDADWVTEQDAQGAVEAVRLMVKALGDIDSNIDIKWIDEIEHDRFV